MTRAFIRYTYRKLRPVRQLIAAGLGLLITVAAVAPASANPAASAGTIRFVGSGFTPMTVRTFTGSELTVENESSTALQLTSAPTAPRTLSASVSAGAKVLVSFPQPGVYVLYDGLTTAFGTKSFGSTKVDQVIAKEGSPYFPMPAYLIVVVENPDGSGIPLTDASVTIPDTSMTFVPWVTVVRAGAKVTFVNHDGDAHMVNPPTEPMLMPGTRTGGLTLEQMLTFQPIVLPGNGGRGSLTLNRPGVYHYYCAIHASYSSESSTYVPFKSFGGYPYVQDGLIVVLPR